MIKILNILLRILYRCYRIDWRRTHSYQKGSFEPACYPEWVGAELRMLLDDYEDLLF